MTWAPSLLAQQLVDIAILLAALGILAYAVFAFRGEKIYYPVIARALLIAGAALFVSTYAAAIAAPALAALIFAGPGAPAVSGTLSATAYWALTRASLVLLLTGLYIGSRGRRRLERRFSESRARVRSANELIAESEARFRALFETTSNSIYCYAFDPPLPITLPVEEQIARSHDAILVECNSVFARALDAKRPADVIGTRMGMLDGNQDTKAHNAFFKAFVASDYRLKDYELVYATPAGEARAIRSSLTGIVHDGKLLRFWGSESNELPIRETKAELERRHRHQELLAKISSRFVLATATEADNVVRKTLIELVRYARADRVALIWYDARSRRVELAEGYEAGGAPIETPVSLENVPAMVGRLRRKKVVAIPDVEALGAEFAVDQQALRNRGLRALLALPLEVGERIVGVATFGHTDTPRDWTEQDQLDLRVCTDLLANFVMRVRSRRALDDALARLEAMSDRLKAENVYLQQELKSSHKFDEIIGSSRPMLECLRQVEQVAGTMAPVLILGETGTGKELIARAIHSLSERRNRPLVRVNCAALPGSLIESELFGYEKGAFTGADSAKRGRFDLADGSTLFLDEIGEIPLELQPKLLRALQDGEIERLGSTRRHSVDVRIIAATNRDLWSEVSAGRFRSDLFFRINAFPIVLPPLRDRGDDIQLLAEFFVRTHAKEIGREVAGISAGMMRELKAYDWPGNVRELESVIQRAIITSPGPLLELGDPLLGQEEEPLPRGDLPRVVGTTIRELKTVERDHILAALERSDWKISGRHGAAAILGIPPSTLRSKMKKYSIERPG